MATGNNGKDGFSEVIGLIVGGLLVLAVVGAVIAAVLEALRELVRALGRLFETLGKLLLLYLGIWVAALMVLPLIDLLIVAGRAWRRRRRVRTSVSFSNFPNHDLLQDPRYLDSLFWLMVEIFIGRRTSALKKKRQSASASQRPELDRKIEDQQYLRNHLLQNEEAFRRWKRDHMYSVLADEDNRHILIQAYGRVWRFCRDDYAQGRQGGVVSPFTALILSKIDLEPNPDPWFVTKMGVYLLSFGRFSAKEGQQAALTRADSERERLRRAFSDEAGFRRFLDLHLFEVMDQIGPFICDTSDIQYEFRRRHQRSYLASFPVALPPQSASAVKASE